MKIKCVARRVKVKEEEGSRGMCSAWMCQQEQLMKNGARSGAWLRFLESPSEAYRRTKERQVCRGCSWKALHVHRLAARYLNIFLLSSRASRSFIRSSRQKRIIDKVARRKKVRGSRVRSGRAKEGSLSTCYKIMPSRDKADYNAIRNYARKHLRREYLRRKWRALRADNASFAWRVLAQLTVG